MIEKEKEIERIMDDGEQAFNTPGLSIEKRLCPRTADLPAGLPSYRDYSWASNAMAHDCDYEGMVPENALDALWVPEIARDELWKQAGYCWHHAKDKRGNVIRVRMYRAIDLVVCAERHPLYN